MKYHVRHVVWDERIGAHWGPSIIVETGEENALRLVAGMPWTQKTLRMQLWYFPPGNHNQKLICEHHADQDVTK